MKRIEKFKLGKNAVRLIALTSVLILLVVAYIVIGSLIDGPDTQGGGNSVTADDIRPELGETTYLNYPIAYDRISEEAMSYILVRNRDDKGVLRAYDFTRLEDGRMVLSYDSGDGTKNMVPYIPPITTAEGGFDYESLYAIEKNDSFGSIYMLTYMCSALGTPYFNERIDLPTAVAERDAMLMRFGLDANTATYVAFEYKDREGKTETHMVTVGGNAISGNGFYYRVDERDVVYYTSSNYFSYAMLGFESFVKGTLIAAGIESDSTYEPYLTTDFKIWDNVEHKQEGDIVTDDSKVVVSGTVLDPIFVASDYLPSEGEPTDGYSHEGMTTMVFDPSVLKDHGDLKRFMKMLVGRKVGEYAVYENGSLDNESLLYLTVLTELGSSNSRILDIGAEGSVTYSYVITAIESVIRECDEVISNDALEGGTVGENDLVKITYYCNIDGKPQSGFACHAVVDLSDGSLPAEVVTALRACEIGELDETEYIGFDMVYTADSALSAVEKLYITAVVAIYDPDGNVISKVGENSYVTFKYYEVVNGTRTSDKTITLCMSDQDDSLRWGELKEKLLGLKVSADLDIELYSNTYLYEVMRDFTEYRIYEIKEFITSELVVSFRYKNASERDPFYGESFFENTMTGKHQIYGLDSTVCENVVSTLGGIGTAGTVSSGYAGQTVAVGLTHDVMVKYGLYAHTIYFELPRGIYDATEGTEDYDEDEVSDFGWYDTLGFTLYISDEDEHGYRYVGSDMYDLVARVNGEDWSFLNGSFTDLWARSNFLFMNVLEVDEIKISLNLKEYYGDYTLKSSTETWYVGSYNGGYRASPEYFEGSYETDRLYVAITSSDDAVHTVYEELKDKKGVDSLGVSVIYNELYNGGKEYLKEGSIDTVGIANYKYFYQKLIRTTYQDALLTKEEQAEALSREKLMSISVKVNGSSNKGYYTYDFYYVDGTRFMVAGYRTDNNGNATSEMVCDFAVSNYGFENIVMSLMAMLNGEEVNTTGGYIDPVG